jgi:acyl-CoA thioesterase
MDETRDEADILDRLRARLQASPTLRNLGIEVVAAQPGRVRIAAVAGPDSVNARAIVHGGFLFTLADTACAYALLSQADGGVTQSAHITYVSAAQEGERLIAEAHEVARTRRSQTFDAKITGPSGATVAIFRGIFQLMAPKA